MRGISLWAIVWKDSEKVLVRHPHALVFLTREQAKRELYNLGYETAKVVKYEPRGW